MTQMRRILILLSIMTVVALGVGAISLLTLYDTAFEQQRQRLVETAHSQGLLMAAAARHHAGTEGGAFGETIGPIREAHERFEGFGATGEFLLGQLQGDRIVFLLHQRHAPLSSLAPEQAEPMRRALAGETGSILGLDYRGRTVLAAYEPVAEMGVAIVVKMDLAEIRAPFLRASVLAGGAALLLLGLGAALFWRTGIPLVRNLEESERRLSTLMANLPGMAYRRRTSPDSRMEFVSEGCRELTGHGPEDLVENRTPSYGGLLDPRDRERVWKEVCEALVEKRSFRLEYRIRPKEGETRWVWEQGRGVFAESGEAVALEGFITDINERKKAEEKLKEANRELDAFAGAVSHDLRSPLTPIIGNAEYIRLNYAECLDNTALDLLRIVEKTGHRMLAVLEDLLALARVGYLEKPKRPVDLGEVITEVISARSEDGTPTVTGELPGLHIPRTLLQQLFDNLIGNALRYGKEPIEIGAEAKGEKVRLFVRDHGPGLPEEEHRRIFEAFYRGSSSKDIRGTGVGLATVRKIATLYGGDAWVEETPGGGCTFYVELLESSPKYEEVRTPGPS